MSLSYGQSYEGQLRKLVGSRKLILPGVRAVIQDADGGFLFVRRSDNGTWVMPAGALELDEAPIDALVREVREETGLHVVDVTLIAVYSFSGTNAYGNAAHRLSFVFRVEQWTGTLQKETDETLDARFFATSELPEIPELYRETISDTQCFTGTVFMKEHRYM